MVRMVSTWSFASHGNESAWPALASGGDPLDAVLEACRVAEEDPSVDSVGYGGLPDADGHVTLDGCVMRSPSQCGSACGLRRHLHPAKVARLVMERTRHIMLVGEAADAFADAQGEPSVLPERMLSPAARAAWEAWRQDPSDAAAGQQTRDGSLLRAGGGHAGGSGGGHAGGSGGGRAGGGDIRPVDTGNPKAGALFRRELRWAGHDTIGSLACSTRGELAGACSTSGTPYKVPGRVGDSPIIGHGLYVDPAAGAATATGSGELIMGVCGAFLAVEEMRRGATPAHAARAVVERIAASYTILPHHQTAFVTMAPDGTWGAAALRDGFLVSVRGPEGTQVARPQFHLRDD